MAGKVENETPMDALNERQRLFVEAYARHFNGTQAWLDAGYNVKSDMVAAINASNALKNPKIKAALRWLYREHTMETTEVLRRLDKMASVDPADFEEVASQPSVTHALHKARQLGISYCIREITRNKDGGIEIKFHDPKAALELIGKQQGLFRTKVDVTHRDVSDMTDDELEELARG